MRYVFALIVLCCVVHPERSYADGMRLERLTDNVYAAIQPAARRFDDSNSLLVVTTAGVVVVDAQAQRANVLRVMDFAEQVSDLPVVMVINTHWHPDHTQGNALYRQRYGEALTIVGHDLLFEAVPGLAATQHAREVEQVDALFRRTRAALEAYERGDGPVLTAEQRATLEAEATRTAHWLAENRDARFLTPTLSYDTFMRLQIGDQRIHLIHFRAHTAGDTVVWLPQHKIMASGDVLDDLPYVSDGFPASWVNALYDIDMMNPRWIVPGHGDLQRDERQLESVRGFLASLTRDVAEVQAQGWALDDARQTLRFDGDRTRLAAGKPRALELFDALLGDAIESAWREAEARPQR